MLQWEWWTWIKSRCGWWYCHIRILTDHGTTDPCCLIIRNISRWLHQCSILMDHHITFIVSWVLNCCLCTHLSSDPILKNFTFLQYRIRLILIDDGVMVKCIFSIDIHHGGILIVCLFLFGHRSKWTFLCNKFDKINYFPCIQWRPNNSIAKTLTQRWIVFINIPREIGTIHPLF